MSERLDELKDLLNRAVAKHGEDSFVVGMLKKQIDTFNADDTSAQQTYFTGVAGTLNDNRNES